MFAPPTARLILACCASMLWNAALFAQEKPPVDAGAAPPGKTLLAGKCFQCHNEAMFRDQRQDRRAWESTLYRMVGRGALWTREEIVSMADYLATDYGPQSPRVAPSR